MSLLLEALKKAERSKHDPAPQASAAPAAAGDLSLVDDSRSSAQASAESASITVSADARSDAERKGAEQLFSAKTTGRPKPAALAIVAILLLAAAAGGGYVWYQTQRPGMPVPQIASAPRPAPAPTSPPPAPQAAGQLTPPVTAPPSEAPPPGPAPKAASPPPAPARSPAAPAGQLAKATPERIRIQRSQVAPRVDPNIAAGYTALNRGELDAAEESYGRVLKADPNNRDALLGLAAAAMKRGNFGEAQRLYRRVLDLDPRDPNATAALMVLSPQADTSQAESRIKTLLSQQPESPVLSFTLGNLYAGQSRWAEAQQAYFRAFSQDPGNADYAFNLAVSLDQLGQRKLAADYYHRAITLASAGPSSFDRSLAAQRLQDIEPQH